ncbi:DUF7553 family protein [Halorubrum depositum]|uniref:DUF7553 family protein n=1 Tax=Halorubrum depositum TaxID=2583992 RepID=UPI0011A9F2EA|nr:hypothetical protein [Halorubrum depositum]
MSKHFEDARYYLGRAAEHAKAGVKEEIEPVEARVKELVGTEEEPEPSRLDRLQDDLKKLEERAEGEVREAVASARARVKEYRGHDAAEE